MLMTWKGEGERALLEEAAERTGRAAGSGWWLTIYGPGGWVRECGLVAR